MAPQGWFKACTSCTIKHLLLAEGHLGEAIAKSARDSNHKNAEMYSVLLSDVGKLRKRVEDVYLSEEILVDKEAKK